MIARAVIAIAVTALMLAVGAALVLMLREAGLAEVIALLSLQSGTMLCSIAAWAAVLSGLVAVIGAFGAFYEEDDDDDGYGRRRGGSKAAPVVFFLLSLGLLWAALLCAQRSAAQAEEATVRIKIDQPEADETDVSELVGEASDSTSPEENLPSVIVYDTGLDWQYMYPLMRETGPVVSMQMDAALARVFPLGSSDADVRDQLCGKAWIAVTGATSEEGPRERNLRRARTRAERAAAQIDAWYDRHTEDCVRPVVLAIDLGQHMDTGASLTDEGRGTGYQRRLFLLSRAVAYPGEAVSVIDAELEARNFLASQSSSLLGRRVYTPAPNVYAPLD